MVVDFVAQPLAEVGFVIVAVVKFEQEKEGSGTLPATAVKGFARISTEDDEEDNDDDDVGK